MMKIDAVITWVDGNDPVHRAKRRSREEKIVIPFMRIVIV